MLSQQKVIAIVAAALIGGGALAAAIPVVMLNKSQSSGVAVGGGADSTPTQRSTRLTRSATSEEPFAHRAGMMLGHEPNGAPSTRWNGFTPMGPAAASVGNTMPQEPTTSNPGYIQQWADVPFSAPRFASASFSSPAGSGSNDGQGGAIGGTPTAVPDKHAVIAQPVPEPQTYALMALGLVALVTARRRARAR
ncbi:PEP-CTERM sorting domain-containing protein [Chitinibacteraceae bacterium HSL-7]